ncbi:aminoglycoside phosphotransferase family protein [Pedobacter sp. HDW13]|uniref:phosphotransferase enzyme family protein n=1 Tax=Pedobacter sp. HDW13 TaxID=2714940 RepID=UPI00140DFE5A|nr:aminoglycoside phosphotransferase family protein [Pedobacter sp. HDW13]QIL38338.1 aminoglycoside phosphotransferase family protein [Pedobacter sp. HDW13]
MEKNNLTYSDILNIISNFNIEEEIDSAVPFGSGHINDTYKVCTLDKATPDFLLQKINHNIFKDVPGLINNIMHVTNHIKDKLGQIGCDNVFQSVLTLIQCKDGEYYYCDQDGCYWRLYLFLAGTKSYDLVTTPKQAFEGGKAFGSFQTMLSDMDANKLVITIPNFHHLPFRLKQLKTAREADLCMRVLCVAAELEFINQRVDKMHQIDRLAQLGFLPLRVTHNDTKFNNVLLNEQDEAQCVIDLDTVMPGYAAFDFGDAVRTIISTAPEDEPDLEKIQLNIDLFRAFTEGFMQQTIHHMHTTEIYSLVDGVLLLPFLMGVRFLTDYLNGDTYYKTQFSDHNLQRARAQFKLVEKLEESHSTLYGIIMDSVIIKNFNGSKVL